MKPIADSFSSGIKRLLLCHLYYLVVCFVYFLVVYSLERLGVAIVVDGGAVGITLFIMMFAPGIVAQLAYVIPLTLHLSSKKKYAALRGVLAGALVTALLNVGALFVAAKIGVMLSPETKPVHNRSHLERLISLQRG
ncbi:MAG: hypothetical protein HQL72_07705 [Magnetococcales bacterium]|nr:hypothetical protein [Magnetococcales bacterium]